MLWAALVWSAWPAICLRVSKLISFQDVADALAGWDTAFTFLHRGRKPTYFRFPDRYSIQHLDATQLEHVMSEPWPWYWLGIACVVTFLSAIATRVPQWIAFTYGCSTYLAGSVFPKWLIVRTRRRLSSLFMPEGHSSEDDIFPYFLDSLFTSWDLLSHRLTPHRFWESISS